MTALGLTLISAGFAAVGAGAFGKATFGDKRGLVATIGLILIGIGVSAESGASGDCSTGWDSRGSYEDC
ncbi:hypothetical protein LAZ40_13275 [Cereibacter sphaeroides]|uniref:hypothetical protein n=1 Tax=Cereibacter sphaeroides TaxID=1063 RepID=UPI001F3C0755|nr:hypothetical protein [Cereibacter sphaeroides]MCE6959993.1 hypothetical protein [Cereibacter sphaeroides]MCE6973078.1 hypothetical protein [Cereibacter sphaeroides]